MERSELKQLETIRNHLRRDLTAVEALLNIALAPRHLSKAERQKRARSICASVRKKGGRVTREELRAIAAEHRVPFAAIGALVGAGYLRTARKGFALAKQRVADAKRSNKRARARKRPSC